MGVTSQLYSNGLKFQVETHGDRTAPAILLTMGLGMQLVAWPESFIHALTKAGYRVICYDNRDIGLSTHLDEFGVPNMAWALFKVKLGLGLNPPYRLRDMAADALGILDALDIEHAHVIGVSMGGMISQRIAIAAPARVLSLTSVMSSSGAPALPAARADVLQAMLGRPTSSRLDDVVAHSMRIFQLIGSPAYPQDTAVLRERLMQSAKRSYHPAGMQRQLLAIAADTNRYKELSSIQSPTLVIHGTDDPLVPLACGQDTADRIQGARFVSIPGMGHDLAPEVMAQVCTLILPHLDS
ncbi:MAG: alpha/beta hydrolase [Cytophagales bacterium]|nr:alpha/beta hydrolase [Cytophagales bacterium]